MRASSWATARAPSRRCSSPLAPAAGQPEPTAWAHVELAKLQLGLGRPAAARRHVLAALAALPGYPSARIELARIDAADGRLAAATREARRAVDAIPTPQAVGLLAELLERTGHRAEARRQRATIAVIHRLLEANGVQVDVEASVFRADNRVSPSRTVELARRARAARPSIYGDDALAWALARAGRCAEALPLATRALRLGTQDPLLYFHRGYAEGCAGNRDAMRVWYAKALDAEPCVLGSLGTGRAGSSRTFLADLRRIIRPWTAPGCGSSCPRSSRPGC